MAVQLKAIDLLAYTIQQAVNEKVVPKRHRWSVGTRLIDCALDAALHIDIANTLDLFDDRQASERLKEQKLALAATFNVMTLVRTMRVIKSFGQDKVSYWTGLVDETQVLIHSWMDSDRKRSADRNGKAL